MKKNNILKERTNISTFLIASVCIIIGIFLLLISEYLKDKNVSIIAQNIVRDIGSLIFGSVAVAIIWELFSKRSLLSEFISSSQLANDINITGLVGISEKWHYRIDWPTIFQTTDNITVYIMYGKTWRRMNHDSLINFAARKNISATFIFPDPEDQHLMKELSKRITASSEIVSPREIKSRIIDSVKDLKDIFSSAKNENRLSIWYVHSAPLYSCYFMDNNAIIAFYNHKHVKGDVPYLLLKKGGTLYNHFYQDICSLIYDPNERSREEIDNKVD